MIIRVSGGVSATGIISQGMSLSAWPLRVACALRPRSFSNERLPEPASSVDACQVNPAWKVRRKAGVSSAGGSTVEAVLPASGCFKAHAGACGVRKHAHICASSMCWMCLGSFCVPSLPFANRVTVSLLPGWPGRRAGAAAMPP